MKKRIYAVLLASFLALPGVVGAQSTGHYPAGAEGIRSGTLPPAGWYIRDYNLGYFADRFADGPPKFHVSGYVNAARFVYMADWKILGATYGMNVIVPFGHSEVNVGGHKFSYTGLTDISFEPLVLSWHEERFDIGSGYAFWAPTGGFSPANPAKLGKGYWSHMLTLGGTYYIDREKTWAIAALNRYEINHQQDETRITPGHDYTLEWGLSKTVTENRILDVGAVGYYQQQVTTDSGPHTTDFKSRVAGAGPEVLVLIPPIMTFASLRYVREFAAKYRPEGNTFTLTLTKVF